MASDAWLEGPTRDRLDLLDVSLFMRAAALANLSSAAREFGLSPAVASARIAGLERMLGARLLHRTTRRVSVTQEGEIFAAHARALLDAAEAARASVGRALAQPHGRLRVTMPSSLGRQHISPLIPAFLEQYPGVTMDLRMTDQIVDLVDEGIDLAIRIGALKDSTLVARKLASNRRVLCASPAYLEQHGTPRHPADLALHECVILADQRDWSFVTPTGVTDVRVSGRLVTDNGEVIRDALAAGIGIGLKSTWSVAPLLASGELVTVLDDYPVAQTVAIWAVYPSRAFVPPKTLAFIEFLAKRFGEPPYWDVEPAAVMR
ncbi:LysR substrate-binding domain-containing protein [Caballeronia sp. LZ062]|uniref:LysR family transcriptional regulator n=1 Tax=unclassified Caballeronia TaxID=2646786 RepID=UPI002859C180|nr:MULTISPECIES: LysR substrate-binding domain-containing protein [unclassified Caballeronia]MDR5854634.1 LysR substrate-binding domain-containing protein [Caballeronia sp. LZ050]MDR5870838.1 LysR substrate-binding domain-containing protein [Caballeronia sp. LZ062]